MNVTLTLKGNRFNLIRETGGVHGWKRRGALGASQSQSHVPFDLILPNVWKTFQITALFCSNDRREQTETTDSLPDRML